MSVLAVHRPVVVQPPEAGGRLRVFFGVRADLNSCPGGDTAQVLGTAQWLRTLGVDVTVGGPEVRDLSGFDLVHLWHLERAHETYVFLERARAAGRPVALSPIYWSACPGAEPAGPPSVMRGLAENAKNLVRLASAGSAAARSAVLTALSAGWRRARRELLASASLLLPNSRAEAALVSAELSALGPGAAPLVRVVVNAIDDAECRLVLHEPASASRAGVVCVGHFDVRKNQLALIRALCGSGIGLTLVGGPRRNHEAYYRACRAAAGRDVVFAGPLSPTDALRRMRAALVHACPSRLETPGLVNLEAATMGCGVVLPDCPPVREYFGGLGEYSGPSPASLRSAVERALSAPPDPRLGTMALERYTWRAAAEQTLEAYRAVVPRASGRYDRPALAP
jgi:hypothetical protein